MNLMLNKWIYPLIFPALFLFVFAHVPVFAGNPPDAANSSLVATTPGSAEVPADGVTTASLTLTLEDSGGIPLAGDTVSLSAPGDGTAVFSPTSITLDASGIATFSATSTTVGTDQVTATDVTTSTNLVALGQAFFDALPTPTPAPTGSSCSSTIPTDAPHLYQITESSGSATLYFVEPMSQFDGYTISYGLTSSADTYNTTFSGTKTGTATSHTVNDLTPDSTYYFKVRANNGCSTGPYSSVLSTLGVLPPTGPNNTILGLGIGGIFIFLVGFALFFLL